MTTRFRAAGMCLAAMLLLAGCSGAETAFTYRLPGHEPAKASFVLVLPFFDARTFRDPNDKLGDRVPERVRAIFIEELREHPVFARKTVIAPVLPARETPVPLAEAADLGRRYNADLVLAGQVFSFQATSASGVPPRAGLFVRAITPEGPRTVFAGEDYRGAVAPGGKNVREELARLVIRGVLAQYAPYDADAEAPPPAGAALLPEPDSDAPAVLVLPYHDRENPANLIEDTGGGAVATSLYQMELARRGKVRLLEATGDEADYDRLLTADEAVALGKARGADFVVRGEVVEFRRSRSGFSAATAAISIALATARALLAEMSGVDIATEVYRVSDGALVYAARDVSHQKYVVRAETTIRRLAGTTVPAMIAAIEDPPAEPVGPLIDAIVISEEERRRAREAKKALAEENAALDAQPDGAKDSEADGDTETTDDAE